MVFVKEVLTVKVCLSFIMGFYGSKNTENYLHNLAFTLRNMAEEKLNYGMFADASYIKFLTESVNLATGSFLCQKYLFGQSTLEQFIEEMIEEDLKSFLIDIPDIPSHIVAKYGLQKQKEEEVNADESDSSKKSEFN
jgi:hypothetical protein